MLNWSGIITQQQVQVEQHFFKTSKKLQEQYNSLCNECSRLASELYEIVDTESKEYKIKKEYLSITQHKLDVFCKKYDIKF